MTSTSVAKKPIFVTRRQRDSALVNAALIVICLFMLLPIGTTILISFKREADVIRLYFGLNGSHPMTLEEIGERFDLTRERVRQIKEKAIRRLKHTSRSKILKTYLG